MRGARRRAGHQLLAEQDLGEPAHARQAAGVAAHGLHHRSTTHDHRHAVLDARHRQAGGGIDDRVADQQLVVRQQPAGAAGRALQRELGRVVVAARAGVAPAVARPQRLDVLGVIDDAVDRYRGLQVVGRVRIAGVAHRDRRAGHAAAAGVGPHVGVDHVGAEAQRSWVEPGAQRGHGLAGLMGARHRRQQRGRHRVDDRARVERCAAPRAVAAVAGATLAGPDLDPVQVGLDAAALGVDDRQRQRRIGRHLQLEGTVGLDRRVAEDLLRLEIGLPDRLAHAHHVGLRRHRPHRADEARRPAVVGRIGRVLDAQQVGHQVARVQRIGRRGLLDGGGAAGRQVGRGEHRGAHAVEAIGVVDAAHLDQRQVLRRERGIDVGRVGGVRLGTLLQRDRVGVHEARRRRGHVQPGLLGRVVHVDRVGRRHVVLQRIGGDLGLGALLVVEARDLGAGERGARHHVAVARDLARPVAHQHAVGAVPQREWRRDATVARQAPTVVERLRGDLRLPAQRLHVA
eukprot:Opistho-1_new@21205